MSDGLDVPTPPDELAEEITVLAKENRDLWNLVQILVEREPDCEVVITEAEMVGRSDLGVVVVSDPDPTTGNLRIKVRQR